mgnify:CR=1 FL=1
MEEESDTGRIVKQKGDSDEKIRRRAVAALQRLGYGWDDIKTVLREYTEED